MSLKYDLEQILGIGITSKQFEKVLNKTAEPYLKSLNKSTDVDVKQSEPGGITSGGCDRDYGTYSIKGLGPDAKTVTTEQGGNQSFTPYAFEAIPPLAFARCAKTLAFGMRKYGLHNWIDIPNPLDHIGKAIGHCTAFLAGDTQEQLDPSEHLSHAICRLMFALDLVERERQQYERQMASETRPNGVEGIGYAGSIQDEVNKQWENR